MDKTLLFLTISARHVPGNIAQTGIKQTYTLLQCSAFGQLAKAQ
jgi:hypothetical protein